MYSNLIMFAFMLTSLDANKLKKEDIEKETGWAINVSGAPIGLWENK